MRADFSVLFRLHNDEVAKPPLQREFSGAKKAKVRSSFIARIAITTERYLEDVLTELCLRIASGKTYVLVRRGTTGKDQNSEQNGKHSHVHAPFLAPNFVFNHYTVEPLSQNVPAEIQQGLEPSSEIRLGRRHSPRITLEGFEIVARQRPETFKHPPYPRNSLGDDLRPDP